MSVFAGLVCCDAARLQLAASAWQSPPQEHVLESNWRSGGVLLNCWGRPTEAQVAPPIAESPHSWQVVSDCRLQEPEALARTLRCDAPATADGLLARALERWGDAALQRLDGEFAFAGWHPGQEALLLARDPVGGYPLYYHLMDDGIAFATDLPLLLRLPFVPRRLDSTTIAAILSRDSALPASSTYYEAIEMLPAGHLLSYGKEGPSVRRWWQPQTIEIPKAEPEKRLREVITAAVEARLRGGRRIAVHLSGGLDSSAVACIAARRLSRDGRRLLAFSSVLPPGWPGPETDERAHIEAVLAQEPNIDMHWVTLSERDDPFAAAVEGFELLGQPRYSNVPHVERAFARLGRELGVDVVLSGFGGDFFASWRGRGAVYALLGEGKWGRAAGELLALHRRETGSWPRLFKREIAAPFVSRLAVPGAGRNGRAASAIRRLAYAHPHAQMRFVLEPGRMEQVLNANVQFFARGFGQSLRFPLLDRHLIEFMLSVPVEQLQRDGENRSPFRRAMQGILPESVRLRRDKGPAFDPMIAARIVAAREGLQEWAERTKEASCWQYVDRSRFLHELAAVQPSSRSGWRAGMFQDVLTGGMVARFIEWQTTSAAR
jgi:asparagine synthase (glutamine-hydrolysing)